MPSVGRPCKDGDPGKQATSVGLVFVLLLTLILVLALRSRPVRRGQREEPWNLSQDPNRLVSKLLEPWAIS